MYQTRGLLRARGLVTTGVGSDTTGASSDTTGGDSGVGGGISTGASTNLLGQAIAVITVSTAKVATMLMTKPMNTGKPRGRATGQADTGRQNSVVAEDGQQPQTTHNPGLRRGGGSRAGCRTTSHPVLLWLRQQPWLWELLPKDWWFGDSSGINVSREV